MPDSQNGWPVDPPRTARTIPGTSVRVTVADGPAGDVLMYVLSQVDKRVEDIDLRSTRGEFDDWGYANRNVRGSTAISNHASATAVDVNATRHPLGARGTFSAAQVREIHRILTEVDHVVRWGGDYSGRADEMHFEINDDPAAVARVAARLSQEDDMTPDQMLAADLEVGSYNKRFDHTVVRTAQAAERLFTVAPQVAELLGRMKALQAGLTATEARIIGAVQAADGGEVDVDGLADALVAQLGDDLGGQLVTAIGQRLAAQP